MKKIAVNTDIQQAAEAIAIALIDEPTLIGRLYDRVPQVILPSPLREVVDLIEEFPNSCEINAGDLASFADDLGLDDTVRLCLWLQLTPDSKRETLPSFSMAAEMLTPPRPKLKLLGCLSRWRADLRNGVGGQRADEAGTWRYDHLWRAAAYEAQAVDLERAGLHDAAEHALRSAAREIIQHPGDEALQQVAA